MQTKIFGLIDDKIPLISNGNLSLSEYYWQMFPNNRTSLNGDLGDYNTIKLERPDLARVIKSISSGS